MSTDATAIDAALFDLAHDAVIVRRADDGVITRWNGAAESLYGWPAAEAVGQVAHDLLATEFPAPRDAVQAALRLDGRWEGLLVQRHRDGSRLVVSTRWRLSEAAHPPSSGRAADGGRGGVVIEASTPVVEPGQAAPQCLDLLRQAEAAEARFRTFVELAPDGVVIVDGAGRIVLVNQQAERLFGYSREELLGQPVELLMPERFHLTHVRHRADYQAHPRTRPMGAGLALFAQRKDGTEFPVEISLSAMAIEGQRLITSVIRDITARKQAEEQLRLSAEALRRRTADLERSNAELQQFAYVASHDLQEPLRMVASYTQLLARRYRGKLDADADEFIAYAVDGATRMQQLINDLLTYSRVGTRQLTPKPTDCGALVATVLADLAFALEESGAEVVHGDLPTVLADPRQLHQLFLNLIGNAVKFRGERRPRVEIGAERDGQQWRFWVRDNGIGIDPQYADRIFVIFQRLHTRADYPGTGIGLAICKRIVERHGGRIWFESTPGEGTTFFFTLPALPGERAAAGAPAVAAGEGVPGG